MSWVQDACRQWAEAVGLVPHGRMGKALKPLVDLYGYDVVAPWLQTYLQLGPLLKRDGSVAGPEEADAMVLANVPYMSPERFAATFQVWKRMSETEGVGGNAP